jgi:hypothetical protein
MAMIFVSDTPHFLLGVNLRQRLVIATAAKPLAIGRSFWAAFLPLGRTQ